MEAIIYGLITVLILGGIAFFLWVRTARDRRPPPALNARGWTLVVDGSNVSYRRNRARLAYMEEVLEMLRARFAGAELLVYCDASLRHQFRGEERKRFEALLKERDSGFVQSPKGRKADDFILGHAREHRRSIVVSHDWFSKGPELEMRLGVPLLRISFQDPKPRLAEKIIVFHDQENPERPTLYPLEPFLKEDFSWKDAKPGEIRR